MTPTIADELLTHLRDSDVPRPTVELVLSALQSVAAVIPFADLPRAGWVDHGDGRSGLMVQRKDGGTVSELAFTGSMMSAELAMEALRASVVTVLAVEQADIHYLEARASYARTVLVETAINSEGVPCSLSAGVL